MIRKALQLLAGTMLVVGSFWNLQVTDIAVAGLRPRAEEDVTVIENQYLPIEYHLIANYPKVKRVGYITDPPGKGPDDLDNLRWAQLRSVMIPRILVRDASEVYVIGRFKAGEPAPAAPANLVQIYDPGTGLVLYKQKTP